MKDIVIVIALVFTISVATMLSHTVLSSIKANVTTNATTGAAVINTTPMTKGLEGLQVINIGIIIIFIGAAISIIAWAYFVNAHPLFWVGGFIMLMVVIIVAAQLSNVWDTIYNNPALAGSSGSFSTMSGLLGNLPVWVLFLGAILAVVLFGKARGGGAI